MPHPIPANPINVERNNPYRGLDRGLFLARGVEGHRYLRVSAARWRSRGPLSALGRLEFQLMFYPNKPVTVSQLAAGTLLTAPGGGTWFDALTRTAVDTPIMAEYWASNIYVEHYSKSGGLLSSEEKTSVDTQASQFTAALGMAVGLIDIDYRVDFSTLDGPLEKTGSVLSIVYNRGEEQLTAVLENPQNVTDPVAFAIGHIRSLQDV